MAPAKMPLRTDEEMGKKDDDHRPPGEARFLPLRHRNVTRPRRIFFALLGLFLFYEFFKHMPTDLAPAADRYNPSIAKLRQETLAQLTGSEQPHPAPNAEPESKPKVLEPEGKGVFYEGDVKFYKLAQSLPRKKYPKDTASRVVLFAASSLRSVSDMLPLACRMAGQRQSYVHFILMGKEEVSIEGIKQVNGIRDNECPVLWHDGRPDHALQSSDIRMERSIVGGLQLLQAYIHPEVVITQGKSLEDDFFLKGVEAHGRENGTPHIGLASAAKDLLWIAFLDSTALRSWNDLQIEMVVHAPSRSSGSVIRLLQSLNAADYLGAAPRLTIELPSLVDQQLLQFLQHLDGQLADHITIRRRIQPHSMDPVESSLRTVESFYPRDPNVTHLLMLSPQTELAPSFYHYLKYAALNYKQSAHAKRVFSRMIGVSLELPAFKPTTDSESFAAPVMSGTNQDQFLSSFLWQAPNSNAALYFGDTWAEFHTFLSNRLSTPQSAKAPHGKLISDKYPAFMEHLLEMIRAKGYYLLYPSFPGTKTAAIATVHTELYQPPEEFAHTSNLDDKNIQDLVDPTQPLSGEFTSGLRSVEKPLNHASTIMPLLDLFSAGLPDLDVMPLLGYDGEQITTAGYNKQTEEYAKQFRIHYGGCTKNTDLSAELFCVGE
ncbi:hypothetical protein PENANT_c027G04164 [Penicillium antarcticum]|uniref:Uncharacterized protein n=1 Tax=Penicillium antarcticum TaxID=416450 RepID=A0A1V6PXR4_9EURO|nr:uncharacterized protein N7508_003282 [Penicillium antarcticum]KAJ5312452.1 hypothetical protein N7508_003282 [Penicillium antarcticum]OQD81517.1 hypothetical protein PENANT_c027G04164 [Penicillium antarcticum]